MEPAFYRGDLLFLTNPASERYHTGDITVYKVPGSEIPIVHRVLETRDVVSSKTGCVHIGPWPTSPLKIECNSNVVLSPLGVNQLLLTKGDNNPVDDLDLYNGLEWLERKHIVGKVRGYVFVAVHAATLY
jgi:signal peptidase